MINIKVLKDFAEVSYQQTGSAKQITKIIGVSEIPALFETRITYDSGILPVFGPVNAYGIQRIIQKDGSLIVLVQAINPFINVLHTENRWLNDEEKEDLNISHLSGTMSQSVTDHGDNYLYKNIYFPNLLMSIHLKKQRNGNFAMCKSGILCFEDAFVSEATQLYDFPFSNIYSGSTFGGICWGDQEVRIESLAQCVSGLQTFLGSTMNTHLFNPIDIGDHEFGCSSQILAYLALRSSELSRFPYDSFHLAPRIKYKGLINYLNEQWK